MNISTSAAAAAATSWQIVSNISSFVETPQTKYTMVRYSVWGCHYAFKYCRIIKFFHWWVKLKHAHKAVCSEGVCCPVCTMDHATDLLAGQGEVSPPAWSRARPPPAPSPRSSPRPRPPPEPSPAQPPHSHLSPLGAGCHHTHTPHLYILRFNWIREYPSVEIQHFCYLDSPFLFANVTELQDSWLLTHRILIIKLTFKCVRLGAWELGAWETLQHQYKKRADI